MTIPYTSQCHNCGGYHKLVGGRQSQHCIFIKIRSHKPMPTPPESSRFKNTPRRRGKSLSDESAMPTPPDLCHQNTSNQLVVPIPVDIRRQADLLDAIFFWFAHYKAQNEEHRDFLWSVTRQKGVLKTEAPLPWLHWRGCHDDHGQTRNQQNWFRTGLLLCQ